MIEIDPLFVANFLAQEDPCVSKITYDRFDPRESLLLTSLTEDALCMLKPDIASVLHIWQGEVYIEEPLLLADPRVIDLMGDYPLQFKEAVRYMINPHTSHRDSITQYKAVEAYTAAIEMRNIHDRVKTSQDDPFALVLPHSVSFTTGESGSAEFDVDGRFKVPLNVWIPPKMEELYRNRVLGYQPRSSQEPLQYFYEFASTLRPIGLDDRGNTRKANILTCKLVDQ